MKILVLSDSHSGLSFMRWCVRQVKPDAIVHLGDYFEDGQTIAQEFPHLVVHQVPGNCDAYRCLPYQPTVLSYPVCGVKLYMTHGHRHHVKQNIYALVRDARQAGAQAVLYGHTHIPDVHQEGELWVLNPGTCSSDGGSVGIIETENGKIMGCKIMTRGDLEEKV